MNPLAAEDALDAALAFYQAPARHHDLLHGRAPLPAGVDRLLRLAGGASPEEVGVAAAHARGADLAAVARFFIEQVLLAHDADHYRLLGVNRDAGIEQIKEHHRLLMRMFHPDRDNGIDPEMKAAHASRINLAYNALRQADSRAAYDTVLRQARKPAMAPAPVRGAAYRRMEPQPAGLMQRMPPALARNLPQFVLAGIALIAAVSVASVYMDRPPEGAIGWEPGDSLPAQAAPAQTPPILLAQAAPALAEPAAPPEPPAPALPAQAGTAEPPRAAAPAAPVVPPAAPAKPRPAPQIQAPAAKPAPAPVRPAARPAPPIKLAQAGSTRTDAASALQPAPPRQPAANPPPPVKPAPAQPAAAAPQPAAPQAETLAMAPPAPHPAAPAAQPAPPAGLSETELVKLVAHISRLYANGDLDSFMALFDDAARSEAGGKTQIRSDYEKLFRNTQQRSIVIWDMDWQRNGDQARGEGSFQAQVVRNGETAARTYTGQVSIEAVRRGDAALIRVFNHTLKR